jgi:hypothetical protein
MKEQATNTPKDAKQQGMIDQLIKNMQTLKTKVRARNLKVKAPEPFDRTQSKLQYFLTQMQTFISINEDKLINKADKVLFASTYLTGTAYKWFKPHVREWQEKQGRSKTETRDIFNSYSAFKKQLETIFRDINTTRNAEQRLNKLRMLGEDVNSYTSEFQQIMLYLDWDKDAYLHYYERGLSYVIHEKLTFIVRPESLNEIIDLATRISNQLRELRVMRGHHRGQGYILKRPQHGYHANESKCVQTPNPYGPQPIELDTTISKEEKD